MPPPLHPAAWGLETDYLHFVGALVWLVNSGLAVFVAASRRPSARVEFSGSGQPKCGLAWAAAGVFLLLSAACAAEVLASYGHLLAQFAHAGALAHIAAVAALLVSLAMMPWPSRRRPRSWWRWVPVAVAAVAALLLVASPRAVSWWMLGVGAVAGLGLLRRRRAGVVCESLSCRRSIEVLLGIATLAVAVAWGAPIAFHGASTPAPPDRALLRAVGFGQGFVLAAAASAVFVGLWRVYLRDFMLARVRSRGGLFGFRPVWVFPALEAAVLALGFLFTQANSDKAEDYVARRVLAETAAVATSTRWREPVPGALDSETAGIDARVHRELGRFLESSPAYRAAILWHFDGVGPRLVAGDSRADSAAFDVARLLPDTAAMVQTARAGLPQVVWRDEFVPYAYAVAIVPARTFLDERADWFLSLGMEPYGLADFIAAHRLQSLALVVLVSLLVAVMQVHMVRSLNETELHALKEHAEAENAAKNEFLAMISHEVRTPLQSVLGYAELAEGEKLPEAAARHVRDIRSQGAVLLRLVQDILDFSALHSGRLHLVPETLSLRDLVGEVERGFADRAHAKGLVLATEVSAGVPAWVTVDRVRLLQVLANLVGNAVKYTARGGVRLTVDTTVVDAEFADLVFTVTDTGAGISAVHQKRLFEPFRKLRDDDEAGGGVGLGLAVCRQVVELLGGEIDLESAEGDGSTFRVRLRLAVASGPPPPAPAPPCVEPSALGATLAGMEVLVVDDNPHVRELLRELLRRLGATVSIQADATSALRTLGERRFDVVLLDLLLPDMQTAPVVGAIRALARTPQDPWLIGVSAGVSDDVIERLLESGLNDFMVKPVSMAGLAETIRLSPAGARLAPLPREAAAETAPFLVPVAPGVRQAFFVEAEPLLARIAACCRQGEGRAAAAEAHFLANGCLALGLEEAHRLSCELEKEAEAGRFDTATESVVRLRALLEDLAAISPAGPACA